MFLANPRRFSNSAFDTDREKKDPAEEAGSIVRYCRGYARLRVLNPSPARPSDNSHSEPGNGTAVGIEHGPGTGQIVVPPSGLIRNSAFEIGGSIELLGVADAPQNAGSGEYTPFSGSFVSVELVKKSCGVRSGTSSSIIRCGN
jgi:hypothetical protein